MSASRGTTWFATTKRWTEDEARAALDAWKLSGLGAHAFARQHGITPQRLYWWRERVAARPLVSLVPGEIVDGKRDDQGERERAHVVIRVGEATIEIADAGVTWVAKLVRELARSA